eukprot:COSAG01_NODE_32911_length_573_cov_0.993671_1_plen_166_part_10
MAIAVRLAADRHSGSPERVALAEQLLAELLVTAPRNPGLVRQHTGGVQHAPDGLGAFLDMQDAEGVAALHWGCTGAAVPAVLRLVVQLIAAGASVSLGCTSTGDTPLALLPPSAEAPVATALAEQESHLGPHARAAAQRFIDEGAPSSGRTPLGVAMLPALCRDAL